MGRGVWKWRWEEKRRQVQMSGGHSQEDKEEGTDHSWDRGVQKP